LHKRNHLAIYRHSICMMR